jgi:hypothetical protein
MNNHTANFRVEPMKTKALNKLGQVVFELHVMVSARRGGNQFAEGPQRSNYSNINNTQTHQRFNNGGGNINNSSRNYGGNNSYNQGGPSYRQPRQCKLAVQ